MSRREAGMTVVEVVVALLLLTIAALASFTALDSSTRNTFRAEQSQDLVNLAQRELEAIRNLDYGEAALSATPATSADPLDPRNRVNGANFALNRDGTDLAEMTVSGASGVSGGTIDPGPTPFTAGDVSGQIFRFVVWRDDPSVAGVGHDLKRVVIAVRPETTAVAGDRGYFEAQSDVADPNGGVLSNAPPPDPGQEVDAQHFWLSHTQQDSTCDRPRQAITSDSGTHNTQGSCSAGNAPDAMYRSPGPRDPNHPTVYDYSNDVALEGGGGPGLGLQLNKQSGANCSFSPGSSHQIHRWITPALNLTLSDRADVVLWARKPDGGSGSFCLFVYDASGLAIQVPLNATVTGLPGGSCVPRPLILLATHFLCSSSAWPTGTAWTKITVRMNYLAGIGLISRLGLGLGVAGGGTPVNDLQFLYDHPSGPSRLDVFPLL